MDTRIIHCPTCGGDKGHACPVDIDRRDGSLIERWQHCEVCEATGEIEVELEPIEMDDLEYDSGDSKGWQVEPLYSPKGE